MNRVKIVIAGGGFAGLSAAMYLDKRLARRADVDVTLVSRENFVLFTPMLHEVAAGDLNPGDIVDPLRRILRHVTVVQAEAGRIDLDARVVRCVGGLARRTVDVEFDHLPRLSKKLRVVLAWNGLSDAERGEEASVKARREAVDHTPEPTARRSALRFDAATLARLRDVTRGPTSPPTTW